MSRRAVGRGFTSSVQLLQELREDNSLMTDDEDEEEMEDLDALAKGLDCSPAALPKAASAADTGGTHHSA